MKPENMMNHTAFTATDFPPSLDAYPLVIMFSITAMMFGSMLALQWLHRIVAEWADTPFPHGDAVTSNRLVIVSLIVCSLALVLPRLAQVMLWSVLTADQRELLSFHNWTAFLPWAAVVAIGWATDRNSAPLRHHQLRRRPLPRAEEVVEPDKKMGAAMLMIVLLIAFGITYVRPATSDAFHNSSRVSTSR